MADTEAPKEEERVPAPEEDGNDEVIFSSSVAFVQSANEGCANYIPSRTRLPQ